VAAAFISLPLIFVSGHLHELMALTSWTPTALSKIGSMGAIDRTNGEQPDPGGEGEITSNAANSLSDIARLHARRQAAIASHRPLCISRARLLRAAFLPAVSAT
jgi:hypothetical protein